MAMQVEYNPSTGEATVLDRGNGGHTISSEQLGSMNESNGRFEFQQLEERDPGYREQYSDNDNALADVDQFALDAAFTLCGGEQFVRGVIEDAPQWCDDASIDMFNEKIQVAFDSGELSSLEDILAGLVAQYLETVGYNNEAYEGDAYESEEETELYESFNEDREFNNPYFEIEAEEFVAELSQSDVNDALDIWDSTNVSGAQRAIGYASQFPVDHPIHVAAEALAYVATGEEHPRDVFDGLCDIVGEKIALTAFAQILDNANY